MKKTLSAICIVVLGLLAVSCYDDSSLWNEVRELGDRVTKLEDDLKADVANLTTLQNKVNSLETSLAEAIAAGDKAVEEALKKSLSDLETKLTTAQQAGDQAIVNELLKEKESLTTALTQLSEGLAGVTGSVEKLNAALKALEASVGAGYTELLAKLDAVDGKIDGKVTDMTAALAALQSELSAAITAGDSALAVKDAELATALAEAIAKIAVVNVATVDGKIVLTLADGSTVAVSAPLTNVSNTGLVTIVEVEGVKYWAVVEADGTAKNLEVVVGHPDQEIDFQVNDTTGELEYSVNGGEWIATGIKAAVEDANSAIVTGFVDAEDHVEIVINGTKVVLPKYVADEALLEVSNDDFFVMYGASKTVELTAEGVSEYHVMAKPDGWKAKFNGTSLVVTAPTKAAAEIGAAEMEGEILIHATANDGSCKVMTINVATGKGLTIDVDLNGNLTIVNAYAESSVDRWSGEVTFGFTNFYVGIAVDSVFTADPKAYLTTVAEDYYAEAGFYGMFYNQWDYEFQPYEEGVYEVDVLKTSVASLYQWMSYNELPYGEKLVVWVAPTDSNGSLVIENAEYISYASMLYNVEVAELTHNSAKLNIDVKGATAYYVGITDASFEQYGATLQTYMSEGGLWMYLQNPEYLGYYEGLVLEDGTYTGEDAIDLIELNYGEKLNFNTKYYVWVFPYQEGTAYTDYKTQFEPYVMSFTTLDLMAGGDYAVEFSDEVVGYKTIDVTVTPSEGTESVYYYFYDATEWAEMEEAGDAAIIESLFANCYWPLTEAEVVSESYLEPGSTYVLATVSVGTDGKYGEVVAKSFTTVSYPTEVNAEHTATFGEPVVDYSTITVNVTPAAGTTAYWAYMTEAALSRYETEVELVAYVLAQNSLAAAGNANVSYVSAGDSRTLVVVVVGEDNKYNIYKKTYSTNPYPYSEEITVALDGKLTYTTSPKKTVSGTLSVTGADKVAVWASYSGSLSTFEGYVVANSSSVKFIDVVDGKASFEYTSGIYGDYMVVYATPVVFTDGVVTAIGKNPVQLTISENI